MHQRRSRVVNPSSINRFTDLVAMSTSHSPLLELRSVHKSFGAVRALAGVDLAISAGEVVALVGDNGAGKSTLIKAMAGVAVPDKGEIYFDGRRVSIRSPRDANALGIAVVYQDLALCDNLDVVANLFLGRERRKRYTRFGLDDVTMETEAVTLLNQLGISLPNIHASVGELSGGQRQVVAIARALVGEPRIVILDEPTAALGVIQTESVLRLIERMRERNLAVVVVSHNLADVFRVADRVVVLRLGKNCGEFSADEAYHHEIVTAITGAGERKAVEVSV
jgi:D-xylose transport system ATP-binding protein